MRYPPRTNIFEQKLSGEEDTTPYATNFDQWKDSLISAFSTTLYLVFFSSFNSRIKSFSHNLWRATGGKFLKTVFSSRKCAKSFFLRIQKVRTFIPERELGKICEKKPFGRYFFRIIETYCRTFFFYFLESEDKVTRIFLSLKKHESVTSIVKSTRSISHI